MTVHYDTAAQGSPEWLSSRAGLLTASVAAKALSKGAGRQTLIDTLAAERITGEPDTDGWQSGWMERGIELEAQALSAYEFDTGATVRRVGLAINDRYPGIGASLDGRVGDGAIECKCPKGSTLVKYHRQGKLPAEYRLQVETQMLVCELAFVDFWAWHPALPPFRITVHRDEKTMNELAPALLAVVDEVNKLAERINA